TSCICSPRRLLALCSPSTHVMASTTLLLPQPFGPTMAVTPVSKASSERSGKLLNPASSSLLSRIVIDAGGPEGPPYNPVGRTFRSGTKIKPRPAARTIGGEEAAGGRFKRQVFRIRRLDNSRLMPVPNIPPRAGWPLGRFDGGQSSKPPFL